MLPTFSEVEGWEQHYPFSEWAKRNPADNILVATSVNSFKNRLDKFWKNQEIMYNDQCLERSKKETRRLDQDAIGIEEWSMGRLSPSKNPAPALAKN